MTKRRIGVISVLAIVVLGLVFTISRIRQGRPPEMTFAACEQMGGVAWMVDLGHPDICPSCAEYRECEAEYSDYSDVCPECEVCNTCREELNVDIMSCPACVSCDECKEENRKTTLISDVCPQFYSCNECMERNGPFPDKCPDGKRNVGQITDAATWFQCCQ